MQKEELLQQIKDIISGLSCDFAEARISEGSSTTIALSGEDIDSLSTGQSVTGSFRVLLNGAWGFVSFNDLSGLERFAKRGLEIASWVTGEEKTGIVKTEPVQLNLETSVKKDVSTVPLEEKFNLIDRYNKILKKSDKIQTTRAIYRDTAGNRIYANSEGSAIVYDRKFCGISVSAVARDGNIIQPFGNSTAGYGGFEIVEDQEVLAEEAQKIALDLLTAKPVDGGTYRILLNQKLAGVFIHEAFGHLSEADFVHENERMQSVMVLGKRFGPDELNVIDDGTVSDLSGYIPYDDEGVKPEKTWLIKDGMLSGRLHSRETAYKMNEALTGNARALSPMNEPIVRMTNTYIENGTVSNDEIFDSVEDGIYALDVIGGETNLEMFTFSAGYGYEIKKGKRGKMLKNVMLSGNVFQTLGNIKLIGNDRKMYGGLGGCGKKGQGPLPVSFGGPHMVIDKVLIGGKQ